MTETDPVIAVFSSHEEADSAVRTLGKSGFDMHKLSIVGKGYHSEEQPVGFFSAGDRIRTWGATGAFWGGIWGLLVGPALFFIPGIGLVGFAGPLVATLISALEGAVVVGGLTALGTALVQLGIPKDQVVKYEAAVKADKFVLIVHGSADDIERAKSILLSINSGGAAS